MPATRDGKTWRCQFYYEDWQGYAPTYLKSINNQLAALFNYAVRYYDLNDNPWVPLTSLLWRGVCFWSAE